MQLFVHLLIFLTSLPVILRPLPKGWAWIRAEAQLSDTVYDKLKVISELLCVQHHYMNLDTFSVTDVADMIETLCTT